MKDIVEPNKISNASTTEYFYEPCWNISFRNLIQSVLLFKGGGKWGRISLGPFFFCGAWPQISTFEFCSNRFKQYN